MITIKHLAMMMDELQKAKQKHPFFAHELTYETGEESMSVAIMHDNLRQQIEDEEVSADVVLQCEITEAIQAYVEGDLDHCLQELAQCAAVIFRMMEMVAKEQHEKEEQE